MLEPSDRPHPERSGKAARTRAALLDAAEREFADRGYDAARLEDVAAAVGIRRASIFYHFRDKRELYDRVLDSALGELQARVELALLTRGPIRERIEAAVSTWVDIASQRPTLVRLLLREIADAAPDRPAPLREHSRRFREIVRRFLSMPDAAELGRVSVDGAAQLTSTLVGSTLFYLTGVPILLPELGFDPLQPENVERHRAELLRLVRRALDGETPA